MKRLLISVFTVFGLMSSLASADGEGQPYYGGLEIYMSASEAVSESDTIGLTQNLLRTAREGTLEGQRELSYNDVSNGHRIYMGVSSAPDWDWEWGYQDFGKFSSQYRGPYSRGDLVMRNDYKAEAWFLHVQFSPRITERLEATLKLGILRWDGSRFSRMNLTSGSSGSNSTFDRYETISGIDEYYGAGLIYTINERWKIRADVNRFMLADEQLDTIGIAAQFWFTGRLINNIFDY